MLGRLTAGGGRDGSVGARMVSVFLRGSGAFTTEQVDDLATSGVRIHTVAGDVIGAEVPAAALEEIANRIYVTEVALSGPLFPECG